MAALHVVLSGLLGTVQSYCLVSQHSAPNRLVQVAKMVMRRGRLFPVLFVGISIRTGTAQHRRETTVGIESRSARHPLPASKCVWSDPSYTLKPIQPMNSPSTIVSFEANQLEPYKGGKRSVELCEADSTKGEDTSGEYRVTVPGYCLGARSIFICFNNVRTRGAQ